MSARPPVTRVIEAAAAVVTLAVLAWLLWASGKGFDVTDEGFYLLTARHPEDVVTMPTSFHHMTSWLAWVTGGSIAALRMVGVLGTAAAGAALGVAALAVSGVRRSMVAVAGVTMGALLAYAWLLLTPSYNTYNAWAVAGATVCVLRAFMCASRLPLKPSVCRAWLFGCGLFLGLSAFVKLPTAAAMGAVLAFSIAAWPAWPRRDRAAAGAWIASGAAGAAALVFLVFVSPREWWDEAIRGLGQTTGLGAGHGPSSIARYAREAWDHFGAGTPLVIWSLCIAGFLSAAMFATASDSRTRRAAGMAIWLVLAAAGVRSAMVTIAWLFPPLWAGYAPVEPFPFWLARFHLHWLMLALALAAGAGLGARRRYDGVRVSAALSSAANRKRLIVGLLLGGGTVAAAFGTANPIYLNLMLALGSWSALLVLAARYAAARLAGTRAGDAVILMVLVFAAVQIVGGTVTASYGLHEGLLRQTVATPVGAPPSRLLIDPETHRLIVDLRREARACGFQDGDDLLAFYNMPGLVYAIGGRSPGLPWFTYGLPGSHAVNQRGLEAAGVARVGRAFILQTPEADPWLRTLAPLGIDFPQGYTHCGAVVRRMRGGTIELNLWRASSSR